MQRLITAAVLVPLALAAVFWLPSLAFFVLALGLMELGVVEYLRLTRRWAPHAPLGVLLLLVPLASAALLPELFLVGERGWSREHLLAAGVLLSVGLASLVLFRRTPVTESISALGVIGFGIPYFVLPTVSLHQLLELDRYTLILLFAVVWLGDAAAFYAGTRWGRRRMAPTVSPKKSWEGAAAGLAAALLAAAGWCAWHLGEVRWAVVAVSGAASVAAQVGDLVESMLKRAAGVKDSGGIFPGHGGVLDRMDALMFAAPVLLLGLWLVGFGVVGR